MRQLRAPATQISLSLHSQKHPTPGFGLVGSISKVSRTSVSITVRSPWPNGACAERPMISFAFRSLSGNPISPRPATCQPGLDACESEMAKTYLPLKSKSLPKAISRSSCIAMEKLAGRVCIYFMTRDILTIRAFKSPPCDTSEEPSSEWY
jgi:hypothetical protein